MFRYAFYSLLGTFNVGKGNNKDKSEFATPSDSNSNMMEEISEENGFILSARDKDNIVKEFYIPEEILGLILSYVDFKDMIFSCRLVCNSWKNIVEELVVRQKGVREFSSRIESCVIKRDKNIYPWYIYYLICHKNIFGKNLLKNNCGQEKFKNWVILVNGGNHFKIEEVPTGSDPLPENCEDFGGYTSCFATSWQSNCKEQVIHLADQGVSPKVMDELQPVIKISEWFAGRYDCGCIYELKVALLDDEQQPIVDFEQKERINQWEGRQWKKVEYEFTNYGPGVRYVSFYHGGKDTQFWAGHYGSKMAGGVVKLYYDPKNDKNFKFE